MPTIIWLDFMKLGRLTVTDVNDYGELLGLALSKFPEGSCAIVIAPHLSSERIANGHRGELRLGVNS